jgi:hypothetical protein
MECLTLGYAEHLLIWAVLICLLAAIVRLVIPKIVALFGSPPGAQTILQIMWWIVGAVILIFCIIVVFDLLGCALGSGGYRIAH